MYAFTHRNTAAQNAGPSASARQSQTLRTANFVAFQVAEPIIAEWLIANSGRFEFAMSVTQYAMKKGTISEGQRNAIIRMIDRERAKAQDVAKAAATAPQADVRGIETAFATARSNGAQKPRLRIGAYVFKPAPATGRNPGAIYATLRDGGTYLGKFDGGVFSRAYGIDPGVVAEVVAAGVDPHNAAILHGKQYGSCAICSRELTDPESIARGIGPTCADKFGWA